MAGDWYLKIGSGEFGPLTFEHLRVLAQRGRLRTSDRIRLGADGEWVPACRVDGLPAVFTASPVRSRRKWYWKATGGRLGPLRSGELRLLADLGVICPDDSLATVGRPGWVQARTVAGLTFGRLQTAVDGQNDRRVPIFADSPRSGQELITSHGENPTGRVTPSEPSDRSSAGTTTWLVLPFLLSFVLPPIGPTLPPWGIIALTLIAAVILTGTFYRLCRPNTSAIRWSLAASIFMGLFGAGTFLRFVTYSEEVATQPFDWEYAPLWLISKLGETYQAALEISGESASILQTAKSLVATFLSVGLLEEALKLLPAFAFLLAASPTPRRQVLFVAAISGATFGLCEGLYASFEQHLPDGRPFTIYVTRMFGCSFAHAMFSSIAVALLTLGRRDDDRESWGIVRFTLHATAAVALVAIPHSLYDVFLSIGSLRGSATIISLSVGAYLILLRDRGTQI